MVPLRVSNDTGNNHSNYVIPFSSHRDTKVMVANVARAFVVPALANKVFFNIYPSGSTFWVDDAKTAAIPADVADGSAPEMNPSGRGVSPGHTLSVITSVSGAIIQANYYA